MGEGAVAEVVGGAEPEDAHRQVREPPGDRRHRRGLRIWPRLLDLAAAARPRRADAPASRNGLPQVLLVGERLQRGPMGQVPLVTWRGSCRERFSIAKASCSWACYRWAGGSSGPPGTGSRSSRCPSGRAWRAVSSWASWAPVYWAAAGTVRSGLLWKAGHSPSADRGMRVRRAAPDPPFCWLRALLPLVVEVCSSGSLARGQ